MASQQNGEEGKYMLATTSMTLLRCLTDPSLEEIVWAKPTVHILSKIQQIYDVFNLANTLPDRGTAIGRKLKDLEKYIYIDIEKQIAKGNHNVPHYMVKIGNIIDRTLEVIINNAKGIHSRPVIFNQTKAGQQQMDLSWAALEASFIEFGFCSKLESLYDIDDVSQKLDSMKTRADKLAQNYASQERGRSMIDMQQLIADYDGVKQSMSARAKTSVQKQLSQLSQKLDFIEGKLASPVGDLAMQLKSYIDVQNILDRPHFVSLHHDDYSATINNSNMHPNTRGWLLDRFRKWMNHPDKRVCIFAAKDGFGKTTVASAICKLHFSDVVANHFFGNSPHNLPNQLSGLIQSFVSGLARTEPTYLQHIENQLDSSDIQAVMQEPWRTQYDVLLRQPMKSLYKKPMTGWSRLSYIDKEKHVFVIDGLGRCLEQDYLRTFLVDFIKDFPPWMKVFLTINTSHIYNVVLPDLEDYVDTIRLDDRYYVGRHIKDVETYIAMAISALLQEASQNLMFSNRARSDEHTLQMILEELTKYSCGRFDYALELIDTFAEEMEKGGQFLGSIKKAMQPLRERHGAQFDEELTEFASAFRSYRDREGRDVQVTPVSSSHSLHLLSLSRIAKLRARHQQD